MIQLSDHFSYSRLLRYTLPSIIMLVFTSIYGVVDGFFVSNFVGKTPFAAVNFIMPFLMILGCVGFLFGTGGGALIAKTMGEGKPEEANRLFSMLVWVSLACGGFCPRQASFFCVLSPQRWEPKVSCWNKASSMGKSSWPPSLPTCFNLNFNASLPPLKSQSWAFT